MKKNQSKNNKRSTLKINHNNKINQTNNYKKKMCKKKPKSLRAKEKKKILKVCWILLKNIF